MPGQGGSGGSGASARGVLEAGVAEAEEEESKKSGASLGSRRTFDDFECPTCSAYNPHADFGDGDEVNCAWCGVGFDVLVSDEGKLKLREN